jgi:hypothetical protein
VTSCFLKTKPKSELILAPKLKINKRTLNNIPIIFDLISSTFLLIEVIEKLFYYEQRKNGLLYRYIVCLCRSKSTNQILYRRVPWTSYSLKGIKRRNIYDT